MPNYNWNLTIPPWLQIAEKELGVSEVKGSAHNSRIVEYQKATSLKASDDETPWCSAFVNWCMLQAGVKGTNSSAARSWLKWGVGLSIPAFGCVVVLSRGDPIHGHVGLYLGNSDNKTLRVFGGNQSDSVSIANYPQDRVLAYRWP